MIGHNIGARGKRIHVIGVQISKNFCGLPDMSTVGISLLPYHVTVGARLVERPKSGRQSQKTRITGEEP